MEDATKYSEAFTDGKSIGEFLIEQSTNNPEAIALVFNDERTTYRQLHSKSQALAAKLHSAGISSQDKVGLLFPNHSDYVVAFFAITLCDAIIVPINPLLKAEEISHILADSESQAIIVHELVLHEVLNAVDAGLIDPIIFCFEYQQKSRDSNKIVPVKSEKLVAIDRDQLKTTSVECFAGGFANDLAVIIYTSGTTGKPKGAMLTHANLRAAVSMTEKFLEFTSADRFLAVIPLCHIYGLTIVLLGLISKGGTLVIATGFEPANCLKLIEEQKITFLPAVPAMFQFMLLELQRHSYVLSTLRVCLSGAAPMPTELFEQVKKAFMVPIVEGYGLTETSSIVSVNPLHGTQKIGSVGVPLPGVQIKIVMSDGSFGNPGEANVGEVAVSGANVMRGYYRSKAATDACFKDNWLLTGDLGYLDEESYLFLVGRTKELIIRGGQNIYPREVEDVIMKMPAVLEVAVIGVPDKFMGERVKAFVVLKQGFFVTEEEVKSFCSSRLAEFKVPRLVEFLQAIPRNATGKALKRLLQSE